VASRKSTATGSDLRTRLVREATEILAHSGFAGLTVRRVAEAAGCSTIGIYTHFNDKNGLIEAVLLDAFADFDVALRDVDAVPVGRAQLVAGAHTYRDWALRNRSRYMVMFTSYAPHFEVSAEASARMAMSLSAHNRRIAAAVEAGDIAMVGDLETTAYHIWACIHGHVMLDFFFRRDVADEDARRAFDRAHDLILEGLAPARRRRSGTPRS
jgi:AcrR family transcriptional regulator